jgi:hypothetical protein
MKGSIFDLEMVYNKILIQFCHCFFPKIFVKFWKKSEIHKHFQKTQEKISKMDDNSLALGFVIHLKHEFKKSHVN